MLRRRRAEWQSPPVERTKGWSACIEAHDVKRVANINSDVSSSAYQVVLAALLGELGSRLPAAKLSDILEQTGR